MAQAGFAPSPLRTRAAARRRGISLTPLIDVVFILLVFFMLASSFLDWRHIALQTPAGAAAGVSMTGALLVEVRTDSVRLAGQTLTLDALVEQVARQLGETPDRRILVAPAQGVSLQRAVSVLDRLAAAGADDISLVRAR